MVDLRALAADGDALVAEVVEDVAGPGDGAAGHHDVRGTRRGGRGECLTGAFGDRVVRPQQRSVQIGGDELVREHGGGTDGAHVVNGSRLGDYCGSRVSRPPR